MKYLYRLLKLVLNVKFYPPVMPEIDVRYRLPSKGLSKMRALNVGVGSGYSLLARQLPFLQFDSLTLLDVHEPYLKDAQSKTWETNKMFFVFADVREYPVNEFDIVMMFDVLEHLPKEDSINILKKIKGKAVVFIPLEKEFRKNVYDAESQDHLSLWTEEDFINLGFKTEVLKNFHREDDRIFDALWAVK